MRGDSEINIYLNTNYPMTETNNTPRKELGKFIHKRIITRLWLYFGISAVLLGVVIYNILKNHIGLGLPLVGLVAGVTMGIVFSRINKLSWDQGAAQVISRMDTFGIVLLVVYIVFEVFREHLVGYFVHGPSLFAVSFAVLAGVMYGRVLGMRGRIRQIFRDQNINSF
jgi:hypothetical protein